jgi:hypothetical protein
MTWHHVSSQVITHWVKLSDCAIEQLSRIRDDSDENQRRGPKPMVAR